MSLRLVLAASAALALASPVFAQTAAPPYATTAEAEAALQARGAALMASMEAMKTEMGAAATAAGGDRTRLTAALDAIVARYQPAADAFAAEMEAFFANPPADTPPEQRAGMAQAGPLVVTQLRGLPDMMRQEHLAAAAGAAAGAGAGE